MYDNYKCYGCYNKNEEIRMKSSSGGIFTLIAEEILKRDGIVFGASFNSKFEVEHIAIENIKSLEKLRGSKYTQSKIGDCFKSAREALEQNKYVLFTGTPCQISGLKYYLKKDYDKLYTQDVVCHGVVHPKVWKKYLKYRKKIDGEIPQNISFRNKDNGWKIFNTKFEYKNKEYKKNQYKDIYMQAFLKNTSLMRGCYNCQFKDGDIKADITLGDLWGIENILPELDDNKGTSLVIVNSEKGKELFACIKNKIIFQNVDLDEAIKYNPSIVNAAKMDPNRDKFFENLSILEFDKLVKKYTYTPNLIKRVYRKIMENIRKIINH